MHHLVMIAAINVTINTEVFAQTNENYQDDANAKIFTEYFRNHWDDIHDVIMRFHKEDPSLKGIVFIHMVWQNGLLFSATVDSNNTGNQSFAQALMDAMFIWNIPGLSENWAISLPIKTEIMGSNHPEFQERAILTGSVLDINGNPVPGATLILTPTDNLILEPDTFYSNREGIFIRTLIPAGSYSLICTKNGYPNVIIENLSLKKGGHLNKTIIMN